MKKKIFAVLTALFWICSCDSTTSPPPSGPVELNTFTYSGTHREYNKSGLLLSRELNEQEIRAWRQSKFNYLLDTLRLADSTFTAVLNAASWQSDTTDVKVDRFLPMAGAFEVKGDSLFLHTDHPEYYGGIAVLAFKYVRQTISIVACSDKLHREDETGPLGDAVDQGLGKCAPRDLSGLGALDRYYQEDVLIKFSPAAKAGI